MSDYGVPEAQCTTVNINEIDGEATLSVANYRKSLSKQRK